MSTTGPTPLSRVLSYLAIAFGWTWGCWIGAWLIAQAQAQPLQTGNTLFQTLALMGQASFGVHALFAAGVFGPLLGYLVMRRSRPFLGRTSGWPLLAAVLIPLVSVLPALVLSALFVPPADGISWGGALVAIGLYAASNLVTSGTEEFGWRGYLYPALRSRGHTFWSNAWRGGLIWAAWHLPLMILLYAPLGWAMIPTLAGFAASIVAMNYVTNAVYEHSNSILLAMVLHALNNTATFALMLLFPTTPFTIVTALMAWVFVGILERKLGLGMQRPTTSSEHAGEKGDRGGQ